MGHGKTPSIARSLAGWAAGLRYEELPAPVVDKVKAFVLAPLLSAAMCPQNGPVRQLVSMLRESDSRADGAMIVGDGARVTREAAMVANAEIFRAVGLDDSYRMLTHPGPVLVSVALTEAELRSRNGRELLTALAAGYEVHCRLARDFVPAVSAHGFRPAPVFGTLGAAVVSAKLLGLDEEGVLAAIAIATSSAGGLNEPVLAAGRNELQVHTLNAARQGAFAGSMAGTGMYAGTERCIEGPAGLYASFAGSTGGRIPFRFTGPDRIDLSSITEGLGQEYVLRDVIFKLYHTTGYNQPVIELMAEMRQKYELDPAEIEEIVISLNHLETLYPSPAFPRDLPTAPRVGSTQYVCAYVAVRGAYPVVGSHPPGPGEHGADDTSDVVEFMGSRVRLRGIVDHPALSPEIAVRTRDGRTFTGCYSAPRLALDFAGLVARVQECVPGIPGGRSHLEEIISLAQSVDSLSSVDPILAVV